MQTSNNKETLKRILKAWIFGDSEYLDKASHGAQNEVLKGQKHAVYGELIKDILPVLMAHFKSQIQKKNPVYQGGDSIVSYDKDNMDHFTVKMNLLGVDIDSEGHFVGPGNDKCLIDFCGDL